MEHAFQKMSDAEYREEGGARRPWTEGELTLAAQGVYGINMDYQQLGNGGAELFFGDSSKSSRRA